MQEGDLEVGAELRAETGVEAPLLLIGARETLLSLGGGFLNTSNKFIFADGRRFPTRAAESSSLPDTRAGLLAG